MPSTPRAQKFFPGTVSEGLPVAGPEAGTAVPLWPVHRMRDWQLCSELLPLRDPESEFYTLDDIQACVGSVSVDSLRRHAVDLWRGRRHGHYRLNFLAACCLIKRYMQVGRNRHSRGALEALVEQRRRQILDGTHWGG